MRAASKRRGIEVTSISRPIRPSDFTEFDLILAMDRQNKGTFVYLFVLTSSTPPPNPSAHKLLSTADHVREHVEDILNAYERWRFKEPLPPDAPKKVISVYVAYKLNYLFIHLFICLEAILSYILYG
jgi:protein-tyrosine phosphatase